MVDLIETAKTLSLNFNKLVFYNKENDSFMVTTNLEILRAENGFMQKGNKIVSGMPEYLKDFINDPDPYVCLFDYETKDFKADIECFYKNVLKEPYNNISIPKFKKLLKENNEFFEKWTEYFSKSISFDFYFWTVENGLVETEADKNQYKAIRELFLDIYGKNYCKYFSDRHLFYLPIDYDYVNFLFLGNANVTNGISFYLNDLGESCYKYIRNCDDVDYTGATLSQCLSLYYEGDGKQFDSVNPYGEDGLVTSIGFDRGVQYENYIPKSLANRIIKYLSNMREELPRFLKSKSFKKVKPEKDLYIHMWKDLSVFEMDDLYPEFIHFDFQDDLSFEPKGLKVIDKSIDFTLAATLDNLQPFDSERVRLTTYIVLTADNKTELLDLPIFEKPQPFYPFENMYKKIFEKFKKEGLPNKIHINSSMPYGFLIALLRSYIESGKVSLIPAEKELITDVAFKELDEAIHRENDDIENIKA